MEIAKPPLALVASEDAPVRAKETVAQRIQSLQAEAKQLAKDHVRAMSAKMLEVEQMAAEIAEGGDAYPAGVRDVAGRLVDEIEARVQTLEAIVSRTL